LTGDRCVFCGRTAQRGHHVTGRDGDGAYFDPELVASSCHDDHELVHDDLKTLGLNDAAHELSLFERVLLRLQRLSVNAARFAEAHPDWPWAARIAEALARWAAELERAIRHLDARDPGWRTDPGFYPDGQRA
jgi:hypothetical protein